MTPARNKPLRVTSEHLEQRDDERRQWAKQTLGYFEEFPSDKDETLYYVVRLYVEIPELFQRIPKKQSTCPKINGKKPFHCDWTDSIEANQNAALKELTILRRNERIPKADVIVKFLTPFSAEDINKYRKKIFEFLRSVRLQRKHQVICPGRLVAVVGLELTNGEDGEPNNTVHLHCLTKDPRNAKELRNLFSKACEYSGLVRKENFQIVCRKLWDGYRYLKYFTKFEYVEKVILLKKESGLQRFYEVGGWFEQGKLKLWKDGDKGDKTGTQNKKHSPSSPKKPKQTKKDAEHGETDKLAKTKTSKPFPPLR